MTLYQEIVKLGVPHGNYASDLHFPVTAETTALVKKWKKKMPMVVNIFSNKTDNDLPWYEVPFAYEPYWEARYKKKNSKKDKK